LRPTNWTAILLICALVGGTVGYILTLYLKPTLIPPSMRLGSLVQPTTVLLLGTDVVYTDLGSRHKKIDQSAFTGRSDTIMVCRLDPIRNSLGILSIPRDTDVHIPDNGVQKINAANAIGGAKLAVRTVGDFLQIPIEHFVVLNVHGLVDLVNELGGITVDVPQKMKYMDWTAKLKIDLEPGPHTLTGNQSMGFVRFRHDALGDIGRVQRQQIFIRAVLAKAVQPESWSHLPRLMEIANQYVSTDMSVNDMISMATFARAVPKKNQTMVMLPGNFSGNGWISTPTEVRTTVGRLMGSSFVTSLPREIRITIENASATPGVGFKVAKILQRKGYITTVKQSQVKIAQLKRTRVIAQRGNAEEAEQVLADLGGYGDIVNASVGDIESTVTVLIGDDLIPFLNQSK
jgi:polyisoprenyl-teichoic acid--peptidoglycan teichoic acid transferase